MNYHGLTIAVMAIVAFGTVLYTLYSKVRESQPQQDLYPNDARTVTILRGDPKRNHGSCSICFDRLDSRRTLRALSCGHVFHLHCINNWLINKNTCPNCRAPI